MKISALAARSADFTDVLLGRLLSVPDFEDGNFITGVRSAARPPSGLGNSRRVKLVDGHAGDGQKAVLPVTVYSGRFLRPALDRRERER